MKWMVAHPQCLIQIDDCLLDECMAVYMCYFSYQLHVLYILTNYIHIGQTWIYCNLSIVLIVLQGAPSHLLLTFFALTQKRPALQNFHCRHFLPRICWIDTWKAIFLTIRYGYIMIVSKCVHSLNFQLFMISYIKVPIILPKPPSWYC